MTIVSYRRDNGVWVASVIPYLHIRGYGMTEDEALLHLTRQFTEYLEILDKENFDSQLEKLLTDNHIS